MDLALAIAELRGAMAGYRLNHSHADGNQVILEWRGPGDEPTQQELDDAWVIVSARIAAEEALEDEEQTNKRQVINAIKSLLENKTPAEIYTMEQANIDNISSLAEAKAFLRSRIPLIEALLAWTIGRD